LASAPILGNVRALVVLTAVSLVWAWSVAEAQDAQPPPAVGPPFAEVEATWNAFWTQLAEGDLAAAWRYVHSSRRYLPSPDKLSALQDLAQQMAFCQLEATPLPPAKDEAWYLVRCRHGGETAETIVIIRRDTDGAWRLIPF
jgi:hypothetical protein